MFQEIYPILSTTRLPEMLHFYRDLLGAAQTYRFPDDGPPAYVGLRLGAGSELGLAASDTAPADRRHVDLCVYADDCDAAVTHLRAHGVTITEEPADQPWGERMARATDPDGNPLVILSRR
ncbi:VOC family protein [Catenuloplanes atrovinosus]|uniref:Glyoxalase superfamily protein PhnB n=1 Tax=Catenuloplanes atrovinosus TaxID=137266 RepID=A0AAE3YUR8_9ACTN|nr:VOC family protein [Catenuloplanes atrovinosus]MDR7279547.1 putative glyoxalase superfamily protein PhnB [Catenuloplanes atrovinosus]